MQNIFVAYITNVDKKKALLLTYGGEELNDLIESLPCTNAAEGEDSFCYTVILLTNHFNPKMNIEMQRYIFRHKVQQSTKIDEFIQKLHQLSKTCNFTDTETEINSQLISGCKSPKSRENGLSTPDISLNSLL